MLLIPNYGTGRMKNDKPILSINNLKLYFNGDGYTSRAVDGISLSVFSKELVCLVGESGCGKSVTAFSILGLVPAPPGEIIGGDIFFKEQNIINLDKNSWHNIRGRKISMVFQEPLTSLNPVFCIGDQISESILAHNEHFKKKDAYDRTIQLLADVGIPSPETRFRDYPHQLSGGQLQRVMIAIALACEPELIIMDEPTTALDVTIQFQILSLIKKLQKDKGLSVLYITHDLSVVAGIADRIYVMYAGLIVEEGSPENIFEESKHPYTMGLLASLPHRNKRRSRLFSIPGNVPDPAKKPSGCIFHPRCQYSNNNCSIFFPELLDYGQGHKARCPVIFDETNGKNNA